MIYLYLFGTCFHFIYVFMIIGNENAPNRHHVPKYQDSPESCLIPQITPKFERLIHLSPLQSTNNLHEILYHVLGVFH